MGKQDPKQPESRGRSALSVYLLRDIARHRILGAGYGTPDSFAWAHGAEQQDFELIDRNLAEYSVIADGLSSEVHAQILANGVFTAVRANQLALNQLETLDWEPFDSAKNPHHVAPKPLTAAGTFVGASGPRPLGLAADAGTRTAGPFELRHDQDYAGVGFSDAEHRERLESLVLQQAREMATLNSVLDQVRALRDLSVWAQRTSASSDAVILASDLSLALGERPGFSNRGAPDDEAWQL
jgi:hypothetical protein